MLKQLICKFVFEPVFIISTGRTGTMFFESFFEDDQKIDAYHEPFPDLFDLMIAKFRSNLDEKHVRKQIVGNRFTRIFSAWKKRKIYLESNPNLLFLVSDLKGVFPKARFIFLTRDPKTYLTSAYSKSPNNTDTMFFYGENDHRKRITAKDFTTDIYKKEWDSFSRFEKIAWYWDKGNREIISQTKRLEKSCIMIKFEDFFIKKDNIEISRFLDFIGIKSDNKTFHEVLLKRLDAKKNPSRKRLINNFEKWPDDMKRIFEKHTKNTREKLGYI